MSTATDHQRETPVTTGAGTPQSSRPQFSLRAVFALMTGVSLAAALAVVKGVGTLPHSLGMLLAAFNVSGQLAPLQTKTARPKCFVAAWLLFSASMVLPAVQGCNGNPADGWEVAWETAVIEGSILANLVVESDPQLPEFFSPQGLLFLMLSLANLLMLASPLFLRMLRDDRRWVYGAAFAVSTTTVWAVCWLEGPNRFYVGYYVWCASFAVLLAAYRLRWAAFVGMCACSILWIALFIGQ